ncbi:hypothetical protein GGX14DRAFT_398947 [Mycena pura]|uniref:F-box domain-containing protein n=1 Tax=Mycena pura TaxID=153505 RepID=A0AAD6V5D0_9AGAR|nr:hypothetical protein GGX14DRAFT_398947 [Mycena pura]
MATEPLAPVVRQRRLPSKEYTQVSSLISERPGGPLQLAAQRYKNLKKEEARNSMLNSHREHGLRVQILQLLVSDSRPASTYSEAQRLGPHLEASERNPLPYLTIHAVDAHFDLKWTRIMHICRRWHSLVFAEQQLRAHISMDWNNSTIDRAEVKIVCLYRAFGSVYRAAGVKFFGPYRALCGLYKAGRYFVRWNFLGRIGRCEGTVGRDWECWCRVLRRLYRPRMFSLVSGGLSSLSGANLNIQRRPIVPIKRPIVCSRIGRRAARAMGRIANMFHSDAQALLGDCAIGLLLLWGV